MTDGLNEGMNSNSTVRWFWFASPQTFFPLAGTIARWCAAGAALLTLAGLYVGLVVAPTDAQQGEVYRIIFIHVPAAWMSMFIYLVMAAWAAIGLAFNTRLSFMMAQALAPTGRSSPSSRCGRGRCGAVPRGAPTGSGTRGSLPS